MAQELNAKVEVTVQTEIQTRLSDSNFGADKLCTTRALLANYKMMLSTFGIKSVARDCHISISELSNHFSLMELTRSK